MFLELSQKMIRRADEKSRKEGNNSPNSFIGTRSGRGNTVTIVDDSEVEPRKKSGCCGGSKSKREETPFLFSICNLKSEEKALLDFFSNSNS